MHITKTLSFTNTKYFENQKESTIDLIQTKLVSSRVGFVNRNLKLNHCVAFSLSDMKANTLKETFCFMQTNKQKTEN